MTDDTLYVPISKPLDGLTLTIGMRFTVGYHVRLWLVVRLMALAAWIGGGLCEQIDVTRNGVSLEDADDPLI